MTAPEPVDPPLQDGQCAAWAQYSELAPAVQGLLTEEQWCVVLARASDVLWAATGRRWRGRQFTETARLDADPCSPWRRPWKVGRLRPSHIQLPRPDVTAVTEVTVGGAAFGDWFLSGNWLIRTDRRCWPDDTTVTYQFGRLPPAAGRMAVLELATEIGKWLAGKPCELPARVQSVQRQGLSFAVLDDMEFLAEGLTGLYAVDLWIRSVNPHRVTQRPSVWSPDLVRARRT